jgi:hypothetical protein
MRGALGVFSGVARLLQASAVSVVARRPSGIHQGDPYLLLITPGTDKFTGEEQQVRKACERKGLRVLAAYSAEGTLGSEPGAGLTAEQLLSASDYCWVLRKWLVHLLKGCRWCFSRDRKTRGLFVAAIPGIRHHWTSLAFGRRLCATYGRPHAVLSLEPWSTTSVSMVDYMKANHVYTGGIRTQTTMDRDEHIIINTDVLFCKSVWERDLYRRLLGEQGPALQEGCLLSLPQPMPFDPLVLPEKFVLVLGTARQYGQDEQYYEDLRETLQRTAAAYGLPVVLKAHPAERLESDGSTRRELEQKTFQVITDVKRNWELINRASLVISAPSTLLYQAIVSGTPILIVEADPEDYPADEFDVSPIPRVSRGNPEPTRLPALSLLQESKGTVKAWFEASYFLAKDATFIVDYLVGRVGAGGLGRPQQSSGS